jgi:probable F420-dependent oxidoreductase
LGGTIGACAVVTPRLALSLPVGGHLVGNDYRALVQLAQAAEANGVDTVVAVDHVVMGERFDRYPWGQYRFPYGSPWPEPLTVLTAIGAATSTLRLATGILIAPLRPAALLAKTAATIDCLTSGRLELGVATGWQREEYEAMGLDFSRRADALDETMRVCQALWGPSPASVRNATANIEQIWCDPKPVQIGGPPVLFAGSLTRRNVARIVELGRGWIPIMGADAAEVETSIGRLKVALHEAGRREDELRVRVPLSIGAGRDLAAALEGAPELARAGATEISVLIPADVEDLSSATAWLARLGRIWPSVWTA